ncbi:MAG: SdpI family protein [Lachnospiraceae bacterium]|nr:SdpI family protein [Lachnospiraceae bacterium]
MKILKSLMWIVSAIPFVVTAFIIPALPDTVVLHYDSAWKADGWGSKYMNWLFPVIILGITGFWALMIRYYEKKAREAEAKELEMSRKNRGNEEFDTAAEIARIREENKVVQDSISNAKVLAIVGLCQAVAFGTMQCVLLANQYAQMKDASITSAVSTGRISNIMIALIIIIAANYLPKSRMNSTVGLRVSWSMYNETTWSQSNRFAGKVLLAAGIVMVIIALVAEPLAATILNLVIIFAAAGISLWYAHKVYIIQKSLNEK